jgi:hypothetical protein
MTDPIVRANDAKHILNSTLWQEVKTDIEGKLQYLRRSVPITSTDMHTRIILMEQLWGFMLDYFEKIAQTGKIEALKLEEEARRKSLIEQGIAMFRTGGRNTL